MSRRTCSFLAAGSLLAAAALPLVTSAAHAQSPSASIAMLADGNSRLRVAKNLTNNRASRMATLNVQDASPVATAINPVKGNDGLACTDEDRVFRVRDLRTTPVLVPGYVDISAFTHEGASGFNFAFCEGLAMHGGFALATADEQGLVQLRRTRGTWRIDTRVQSPGLNEAGQSHQAGWIRFPTSLVGSANVFNAVAIAPRPLGNGQFLAVAVDRVDGALAVVEGVGTAKPHVVGFLSDPALASVPLEVGNAAVTFPSISANRAVIATATGFAVLDLHKPSAPRLKVRTTVGGGSVPPSSLTMSADGDHIAVADGGRVYGYRNALGAIRRGQAFRKQVSFRLGTEADESVTDIGYTVKGRLAVLHGSAASSTGWGLTMVAGVTAGHHARGATFKTTQPPEPGSLSVWPGP